MPVTTKQSGVESVDTEFSWSWNEEFRIHSSPPATITQHAIIVMNIGANTFSVALSPDQRIGLGS